VARTPIYFLDGKIIAESGDVRVYDFEGDVYLESGPGHVLWTISRELVAYEGQVARHPRGACLEVGLGLGICSNYILNCAGVEALTTIELNPDVVKVYKQLNDVDERHTIICGNGLDYIIQTRETFDFMFFDFYIVIDEDTIDDLKAYVSAGRRILNEGGKIMAWWDEFTPDEFKDEFFNLFDGEGI